MGPQPSTSVHNQALVSCHGYPEPLFCSTTKMSTQVYQPPPSFKHQSTIHHHSMIVKPPIYDHQPMCPPYYQYQEYNNQQFDTMFYQIGSTKHEAPDVLNQSQCFSQPMCITRPMSPSSPPLCITPPMYPPPTLFTPPPRYSQQQPLKTHRMFAPPQMYTPPPLMNTQSTGPAPPLMCLTPPQRQTSPTLPTSARLTNENKQIYLTRLQPRLGNEPITQTLGTYYPHKIFVGSLSRTITPSELALFFRQFGVVIEAKVVLDNTGNSKGYGFVSFETADVVQHILSRGALYLNGKRIAVASAIRKKHDDEE